MVVFGYLHHTSLVVAVDFRLLLLVFGALVPGWEAMHGDHMLPHHFFVGVAACAVSIRTR